MRFLRGLEPKGDVARWLRQPSDPKDLSSFVMLEIEPKLARDRQDWQRAQVQLSKPDFLPKTVKLILPSGPGDRKEQTFHFLDLKPNAGRFMAWLREDPFKPNLTGYKKRLMGGELAEGAAPTPGVAPARLPQQLPAIIGMDYRHAEAILKERGYVPKRFRGPATPNKALVNKVAKQQFPPGDKQPRGTEVGIQIYVAAVQPASAAAPASK